MFLKQFTGIHFRKEEGSLLFGVKFHEQKPVVCNIGNKGEIVVFAHFMMKGNVIFIALIFDGRRMHVVRLFGYQGRQLPPTA